MVARANRDEVERRIIELKSPNYVFMVLRN